MLLLDIKSDSNPASHYSGVIMGGVASQVTGVSIICSPVCLGADQRIHQSTVWWAVEKGIHRWPVDSPPKGPVTRKMVPFDDVIMYKEQLESMFYETVDNPLSFSISGPEYSGNINLKITGILSRPQDVNIEVIIVLYPEWKRLFN